MDQWCAAHGYEITAQLRERGFSEKGPPRKVDSLNGRGRAQLEEFWTTWGFLSERIEELQEGERWTWLQSGSRRSRRPVGARGSVFALLGSHGTRS